MEKSKEMGGGFDEYAARKAVYPTKEAEKRLIEKGIGDKPNSKSFLMNELQDGQKRKEPESGKN